jgi:hypothetical protein
MTRRITRGEIVGLPAPSVEEARDKFAGWRKQLTESEKRFEDFLAAEGGFHSSEVGTTGGFYSSDGLGPNRGGEGLHEEIYNWALRNFGSTEVAKELANETIRAEGSEDIARLQALQKTMLQMMRNKRGETDSVVTPLTDPLARGTFQTFGGLLAERAYYDDATREVGVDFGWVLALHGRESEVDAVRESFRAQLERVVGERNSSTERGWRYKGEEQVLAERERFWEAAEPELTHWVAEGARERDSMLRGGTGARFGRALRRLVAGD